MKQFIKKYGHIWTMSYFIIYLAWFFRLQENTGKPYHVMYTRFDDLIPFCEYFIVPYLLWFAYVAAAFVYFFFTNRRDYYKLCLFLFTGMTISLTVCTLFPNGTTFRPKINPESNVFCFLVANLWHIDPCINVFPSIHVFNSLGVHVALCWNEKLSRIRPLIYASGILMTLICMATVFLKQHSILDVLASILVALILYPIVYTPDEERSRKYIRQYYES